MSVILLILKIIGITLLAILGLILLILLLVLLVPVRYSGKVSKDETIDADVHATWLLHLVHFIFSYHDGDIGKKLKILGITFKNDVTKKDAEENENEENTDVEEIKDEPESNVIETELKEEIEIKEDNYKPEKSDKEAESQTENKTESPVSADISTKAEKMSETGKSEAVKDDNVKQSKETKDSKAIEEKKSADVSVNEALDEEELEDFLSAEEEEEPEEKKTFAQRKTEVVEKIKNIYNKITHYKEIINDPRIKNGVGYAKKKLFEILKHVLPKKLRLDADYGFEDPSTTGYITAVIGALYGKLGNMVKARPDFENEVLKGNADLSGRVRIGTVLFKALQVILKKDCRYVYKLIKAEREQD